MGNENTTTSIKEEQEVFGNGTVQEYLYEHLTQQKCAFCNHRSIIQANDTTISMCLHCFRIIQENIDGLKRFLDC